MSSPAADEPAPRGAVRYHEPGSTYRSTVLLAALVGAGFALDLALGGGVAHVIGWAIAFALIVGAEALTVYAARVMRTVVITDEEILVGEERLPRAEVSSVQLGGDGDDRVLGRRYTTGLPRGAHGVLLTCRDGSRAVLATRHPNQVLAALGADPVAAREVVRPALPEDLAQLAEIDDRSESLFRVAGYQLPTFEPAPDAPAVQAVYVIGQPPVGFVELSEVDGEGYVHEVAVLPSHMSRGYGTQLMAAAAAWARERGYRGIALTTFRDIAWNAPFYAKLGYTEVDDPGDGLRAIRAHEVAVGLDDVAPRTVMRYEL